MTDDAVAAFEKAVALDPSDADARRALAALYARSGKLDHAAALYVESIGTSLSDPARFIVLVTNSKRWTSRTKPSSVIEERFRKTARISWRAIGWGVRS